MRPHVELIQETDLCWHMAELVKGDGKVAQRNLCYDEENGAASTKLRFDSDWTRPGGFHEADTEWYVLKGEVRLGNHVLRDGCYWRAPAGLRVPDIFVKEGTEVLLFREYGDWGFSVSDRDRTDKITQGGNTISSKPGALTVVDSNKFDWMPNIFEGDTQWELMLKPLYRDPPGEKLDTGFITVLGWAPPGWGDDRMIHHPVFEEAYTIDGSMEYNFGTATAGTYFFRPAKVKHGHFVAGEEKGTTMIFRLDGSLINWVTIEEQIIVKATALNYDPKTQAPVIAGLPVRSKSTGPWNLDGQ